jgi:hypothetical protein
MKKFLMHAWDAMVKASERRSLRRATYRSLRHLDSRTLKDIGIEAWNSDLARRLEARQRHEMLTWRAEFGFGGLR